jgi:hypothetical protein
MDSAAIKTEFEAAVATARHALEEYRKEPVRVSKRGAPTASVYFRIWRDASDIAIKWHRQLQAEPEESLDDTIDRILREEDAS